MSIDPNATYTILGSDLINAQTQTGYLNSAITNMESHNPLRQIDMANVHKQANAVALISANAIKDPDGNPLPSDTFYGNGSMSGTSPQSAGVGKNPP